MWDMEEEIIGNRWKELDYDGEVTAVAMISSSPRSLTPIPLHSPYSPSGRGSEGEW